MTCRQFRKALLDGARRSQEGTREVVRISLFPGTRAAVGPQDTRLSPGRDEVSQLVCDGVRAPTDGMAGIQEHTCAHPVIVGKQSRDAAVERPQIHANPEVQIHHGNDILDRTCSKSKPDTQILRVLLRLGADIAGKDAFLARIVAMPLDTQGILQLYLGTHQVGKQPCGSIGCPVSASPQSSELGHEIEMNRIPVAESRFADGPVQERKLLQFSSPDSPPPLFNRDERGTCNLDCLSRLGLSESRHLPRDLEAFTDGAVGQPLGDQGHRSPRIQFLTNEPAPNEFRYAFHSSAWRSKRRIRCPSESLVCRRTRRREAACRLTVGRARTSGHLGQVIHVPDSRDGIVSIGVVQMLEVGVYRRLQRGRAHVSADIGLPVF